MDGFSVDEDPTLGNDNVLYHSLPELATRNVLFDLLSEWRLFAQVNCRSEMHPIAFPEPGPFFQ
jgi:hypothetical protein